MNRKEVKQSLGMNFVRPFQSEKEFKVYNSCKWIFMKTYAEMNSGMHGRLSENQFRDIQIIFTKTFL